MGSVTNVKIEPMVVTWGEDVVQVETITCVADVADSLDGKYFFIYLADGTKYHVWFNTSGGAATDPAPGGSTAQVVALTTGASASTVATAVAAALDGLAGFVSTASGPVVTSTLAAAGYAQASHEGVGTGFTFGVTTQGDAAANVGFVDGEISVTLEEQLVDITAHETGSNILGHARSGKNVGLSVTFKETSKAQLKRLFNQGGGSLTPAGAGATEVSGFGMYKDFTNTNVQAKKLVLHPKVLPASDHTRDITVWKAYANLSELKFTGEDLFMIPVEFKCYPDLTKNERVSYMAFGDGTQTLT